MGAAVATVLQSHRGEVRVICARMCYTDTDLSAVILLIWNSCVIIHFTKNGDFNASLLYSN